MRTQRVASVMLALLCVGCAACARAPIFAPGEPLTGESSSAVCSALNAARESTPSFRALLDTTVETGGGESASFRYAIVGKGRDTLRIDVLPSEGAYTLALITVRGGAALFLDTQEKRAIEGCIVQEVLEKVLGLQGMTPAAVQAIVVGRPPVLDCGRVTVHRASDGRLSFVDLSDQVAWEVDDGSRELRRAHFLNKSGSAVLASAERGDRLGVAVISVTVYKPVEASAEMVITKLSKNPDVAEALFNVEVPAGYQREGC